MTSVLNELPLPNAINKVHAGNAASMQNFWPTNPDGTPKTKKGWPAGLAPGECKQVVGSRGDTYTLKHCLNGGGLVCDCPAWKMQPGVFPKLPGMARTCKHWDAEAGSLVMKQHVARGIEALGEDYMPKAERPEVIAYREAKRARGERDGVLYMPFKRQRQPAEGVEADRLTPPEDGGFFGKDNFALAFDLSGQPTEGYWMSEKLDGVRGYWDGKEAFWSRNGNQFKVPAEVVAQMPLGKPLDGEFWMGRETFQQVNGLLKRKNPTVDEWRALGVKFMVFDAPFEDGNYETRMAEVGRHIGTNLFVQAVESEKVIKEEDVRTRAKAVAEAGGEGLMLREPHGVYRPERTCDLLKVVERLSTEAIVIGHNAGTDGATNKRPPAASLRCRLRSGKEFSVGSGMIETERWSPPAVGTIVLLQYKGLTDAGVPRQPTYKGVCQRVDVDASQFEV
jgi:DNA ligase-1